MFFALCVPSVAYGDYENTVVQNEPSETAVESTSEFSENKSTEPIEIKKAAGIAEESVGVDEPVVEESAEQNDSILDEVVENENIADEPTIEEKHIKPEETSSNELHQSRQIILTSVEGLPSEAIVEFTLDGVRVGLVSNGLITDALPILATDKQRIKACITNKVRIVGAKIKFDTYKKPTEQMPIVVQPINPPEPTKPVEEEELIETEEPIGEEPVTEPDDGNIDKDIEGDVTESEDNEGTTEDGTTDGVIEDDEKTVSEGNENVAESEGNKGTTEDDAANSVIEGDRETLGEDNAVNGDTKQDTVESKNNEEVTSNTGSDTMN